MAHAQSSVAQGLHRELVRPGPPSSPFSFEDLVERIRAEFIEQPGLRLTEAQGCRLWQLDRTTLQQVLATLIDAAFLTSNADGRYTRRSLV
jgi:hypothetical protein